MYIVKQTMQYTDKKTGDKKLILASNKAQELPKELIKEALSRGLAEEAAPAELEDETADQDS